QGNAVVTGYFRNANSTFGGQILTNRGNSDVFVAKYDSAGNLLWARSAGNPYVDSGMAVATDPSDNVYVAGYFIDLAPVIFGDGVTLTNGGEGDVFLAEYDKDGQILRAKSLGRIDEVKGLSVDAEGDV